MVKQASTPPALAKAQEALVFWVCALSAAGALAIWWFDDAQGLTTAWDSMGSPVMGVVYALAAVALRWRPQWLNAIVVAALVPTSIYYLGMLYIASQDQTTAGMYSMASNSQFMPLYYIGAFVALRRGAALISWLHYSGLAGLYVYQYIWPGGMPEESTNAHIWATLLASHPCYIAAMHYITALKGRVRLAEQEAHQSKERFLAMLSHEIRSPLQAMLGSIDLLALKAHSPPERRAVDRLRHAASQLDTHLRDVTEYTRLENPSWQLRPEPFDLAATVRDVCESFQAQAQARGLQLHCEVPPQDEAALRSAHTDERRLRQILGNLIGNALKYTPQGRITVRASASPASADQVLLEVQDTGIGIPVDELHRIFEPYVRLEDRRALGADGSGLGLAVVKRLVDRLGGHLQVDSQLDQGSRFGVSLPLHAPQ